MDESVEINPVENKKSNKKKIILIILGVVLALIAGILCFLLLSKKPVEGAFKEKKYYYGQSTLNVAGPLGTYMFFDTNGTYISTSTTLGRPSGSIGTYKIDGETIYLSTEYYYEKNEDEVEVKIASSVGEGTIKNDIITLESYEFKPISSSEYKKVSKERGYYTYKDIKNAY